jgi:hypothetical protein
MPVKMPVKKNVKKYKNKIKNKKIKNIELHFYKKYIII